MNRIHPILLACVCCWLASAQTPAPSTQATLAPASPAATPAPAEHEFGLEFGLLDGLVKLEELSAAQDYAEATRVGESLLVLRSYDSWVAGFDLADDSWWNPLLDLLEPAAESLKLSFTREEKAHVHYALGVVGLAEQNAKSAKRKFDKANALAGPGRLRQASTYNVGTLALLAGEAWRAQMPEFGGQPPTPGPSAPPAPGAAPTKEEEAPDPLEEARAAYLAAKEGYILRLRIDWKDSDTRANMELVMRRLRELDEIERQREEQKEEEQNDENKDEESEDSESEKDDKQKQDKPEDQEPSDSSEDKQDSPPEDSEEPQEPEEPSEDEQEQQDPSEGEQEPDEQQAPDEQPAEPQQELFLTKEEVQRLLDRLKEHEEQGEQLRERKRQSRRPTARDW